MSAASSGDGGGPAAGLNGNEATASEQQVLDLGIGLGATDRGIELDQDELGHGKPERADKLSDDHLRDERLRPLAGAAELEDVEPVVVRLDERGQRAPLPQGRHVARRRDPAHVRERISPGRAAPS